jgi:hypothetical protein
LKADLTHSNFACSPIGAWGPFAVLKRRHPRPRLDLLDKLFWVAAAAKVPAAARDTELAKRLSSETERLTGTRFAVSQL